MEKYKTLLDVAKRQTGVRYRWDGEVTYGMMERSSRKDKVQGL